MKVTVDLTGYVEAAEHAGQLATRLANPMPALLRAGIYVANQAVVRIDAGGTPPWEPRKKNYAWHILIKTGNLRNSLASGVAVVPDGKFRVAIGTNVKSEGGYNYATALQEGRPKSGLPARPFLYVDAEDTSKIHKIVSGYFLEGADA